MAVKDQYMSKIKQETKPWIKRFGRLGYFAFGGVFILLGILACMTAAGAGGAKDSSGALQTLSHMPYGSFLLFLIGVGLIGYVIWMVLSALKDTEGHGTSRRGLSRRTGNFFSAAVYASIAWKALRFVFGQGDGSTSEQTWSAYVLAQPFGQWLTGLTGAGFILFAIVQFVKGVRAAFMKEFDTSKMNKHMICIAKNTGRAGNISRAIIFSAIGYFLIKTAMTADPDDTRGFDGALAELAQQPHGKMILSFLAFGLILYGLYAIMKGIYQHMTWEK
ncbi:DUF1206 domain-containing protein [Bacillus inaquosorum]|uniref:DUF1206 domain-containing protein n=1 Tax=Bacillus inaquosorum TaxID=483913 RepID=UPI0022812A38|nr:DUF1206 domain-containing protein [Bacillus inaquosorum]MCY7764324.1 DUF1206 domain-containing protein [Bacillus inaquosorum]MCY9056605.1 DUF1206 domain-containing protein [Bacillus inaquosorum]MCY9100267.1 DUF1206 domain-containing protein [Bacillus inaquosorum]MCY9310041.1 DUF1206 domain-containing protein [Bacillus inaquosorum]